MSYTKQVSHQTNKIQKQNFIMVLVKRHSRRYSKHKKHSTISNTKLIQDYQTNIGIPNQQTIFIQTKL